MRAVLVVNPMATTTSPRTRDVLVRALGSDLKLDVVTTQRRGHATDLARQARVDGVEVVVALGGDGTVNEVVNGLLHGGPGADVPALAVVPGGSTNVFARSLGVAVNPVEATGQLLDAVREGRSRAIGLGRADDRWFTFCAGMGLDAEVVGLVEQRRAAGRMSTPGLYVGAAVRHFFAGADRRNAPLTLERPGADPVPGLFLGIVSNTAPWTYFGARPVNPTPHASFDAGLDLFALRSLRTTTTLRHARQLLATSGKGPRGRAVLSVHDADGFTLRADAPQALQVDGDAIGRHATVRFRAVHRALRVLV